MLNTFQQFNDMAFIISDAKQAAKQVREGSLTHRLAWVAFAILASGTSEDKESLASSIAKGATYESFKGTVSKAKACLAYLQEGHEVNGLTLESISTMLESDEVPSEKLTSIYATAKGEAKQESDEEKRLKAIHKQAMAMMQVAHPEVAITKKSFDAHPNKVQFLADAAPIIDARLAAQALLKANESKESAINRLVSEIISLGVQAEVLQALGVASASSEAQAA